MSDKIDQRIVEMSFENQKFEKGISKSKNSLKEFADALKNSDAGKGFSGLEKSVGHLSSSLSMMEQIGIGALRRIGEAAVNAGTKLLKSMTIDPALAGWTKYEQKTAAVQTIMNSTGKSIGEVNGYLEQLMWFSDETSYGFTDMTAALAQMTSSGGNIETLIPLITGVANATAFAGKGAAEFSRAMFNLNQSYGAGNLQLMDWRSLELAGVAGKELKQVFIETGIALGTLDKEGRTAKGTLVDIGTFSTTLNEKWANTKVMEKAFGKFSELSEAAYKLVKDGAFDTAAQAMESLAGKYSMVSEKGFQAAQTAKTFNEAISATIDAVSSGWMRTYEIMFGDLDEAKKNFTALTEILWTVFASGAQNRNEMLAWVKEFGGVSNVFQGFKNIAISVLSILRPISQAFDQMFPPKTKEQWLSMTEAFRDFTAGLTIADSTGDKVRRTFAGLFAVIDIGWQVVKFLGNAAFELVKIFIPLSGGILDTSASLGDFLVSVNKAIKTSSVFQYGLLAIKVAAVLLREGLFRIISVVSEFVSGLWNAEEPLEYLRTIGSKVFSGLIDGIKMVVAWISGKFTGAIKSVSKFFDGTFDESVVGIWPTILEVLKEVVEFISGKAVDGFKNFGDTIKGLDFNKIATFVVGGVLLLFIKQLTDLTGAMTGFTNSFTGVVKAFTKKFLSMPQTGLIKDMAYAIGILSASIWVLSKIPAEDLNRSLLGLAKAIGVFVGAYALLQGINVGASKLMGGKEMATSAFGLTGVAASLLIMAVAVKTISKIEETEVWDSVLVLGAMLGFITAYQALTALISKIPGQQKISMNLLGMSVAITALIGSLALLNLFSRTELESSLGKLTTIMLIVGGVQGVFALAARIGGGKSLSVGILQMAVGIAAMIATMKLLSILDQATIKQSISNLALITLTVVGVELAMGLAARLNGGKKFQTNILATQVGILAMIGLVAIIGNMTTSTLDQGIINAAKMAGLIASIQLTTALASRIAGGAKVQKILGSVTVTMLTLTGVVAILGNMKQPIIDRGMKTIVKMVKLISGIEIMSAVASRIGGSPKMFSSLMGVGVAIAALTGSLALLSVIDQDFLRSAATSLVIASAAIVAISFSISNISNATNYMSKGAKGFLDNVKTVGFSLLALGALLVSTATLFGVLTLVLPTIKQVDAKDFVIFTVGLGSIAALLVVFNHIGKQLTDGQLDKKFNGLKAGFTAMIGILLATTSLFGALGLALPTIKQVGAKDFSVFLIGLGAVTTLLGVLDHIGKQTTDIQLDKRFNGLKASFAAMIGILLATTSLFGALGLVLPTIKQVDTKDFAIFLGGLASITALLGALDHIGKQMTDIQLDKQFNGLKAGFVAMGGILLMSTSLFGLLGLVLPTIKQVDTKDFIVFIAGITLISVLLGAMALLAPAFEAAGALGTGVLTGVLVTLAGLGLVVLAFGGLAYLFGVLMPELDTLNSGMDALVIIGDGIGRFVGSIVGGVGGGVLEAIGTSIANFAATMSDVTFSQGSLDAIMALSAAVVMITGASLIQGLNDFFGLGTASIDTFGAQISGLVTAIKQITIKDAGEASNILQAMKPMAENLRLFADIAKDIPNSGGWLGGIVGDNDIDDFGAKLALFVSVFSYITVDQAIHMTNVLEAMKPMAENLKLFAAVAQGIPNSGGFIEEFMGGNDIDKFGEKLIKLVTAFIGITPLNARYAAAVLQAMVPMATNLDTFAETSKGIPNSGGWIGGIVGDNDIDDFGTKLAALHDIFGNLDAKLLGKSIKNLQIMNDRMLPNLKTFSEFVGTLDAFDGFSLSDFATEFASFVSRLSNVDFSVVAPAMAAMDDITASFQTLGATVLENSKKSFENNKEPFQTVIASILAESIKKLDSQKKELVNTFTGVFKEVTDKVATYKKTFKILGEDIINGLNAGIESKKPKAVASVKDVMAAVVVGAKVAVNSNSPSKVFETIGGWCTLGLAQGLKKETDVAVQAGVSMAEATEEGVRNTLGVHSLSTIWAKIGEWLPKSLGSGVQNGTDWLLGLANNLGIDTGNLTLDGIVTSISGGDSAVSSVISELLGILKAPAEVGGEDIGSTITDSITNSLSDGSTGIGGSKNKEVVKTELEKLRATIEEEQFYGTITIEEELKRYEELRNLYKEGSEERAQIDREIYTRLKTIYEAQLSYIDGVTKAEADAAKEREDLKTAYDNDVDKANKEAYEKRADLDKRYYADKAKIEADLDKKRLEKEKEYNENLTSILEKAEADRQRLREQYAADEASINSKLLADIANQNKEYENAVRSRADTISKYYGLFAEVEADAEVSGGQLLKNLQDQTAALNEWQQSLASLGERGVGDALIEELQAMGPSSKAQINALLTLTDDQLTEYVSLFEGKYTFARTKAEEELEGLKDSTALAIQELNKQAAIDLDTLVAEFTISMTEIDTNMATDMSKIRTAYNETLSEMGLDAENRLAELETTWRESSSQISTDLSEKLTEMESRYNTSLSTINTNLEADLKTMRTQFSTTMKTISGSTEAELREMIITNNEKLAQLNLDTAAKLELVEKTYDKSGDTIVDSFGSTIESLIPNTVSTLKSLVPAIKSSFDDINSKFAAAGRNASAGFARGIRDGAYLAVNAAAYLAHSAVTSAEKTLDENSPSKIFQGIGKFVSIGFARGITDYAYQAEKASEEMALGTIATVSQALADMEDSDYMSFTITPVIDLSGIRSSDISQLLNAPIRLGNTSGKMAVETIQNGSGAAQTKPVSNTNAPSSQPAQGAVISMTQNNYSPKPLSRLEIYRQTQNQLSALKGLVSGV